MNEQLTLRFSGATFDYDRDYERLGKQMRRVLDFMVSERGYWQTLHGMSLELGYPEASISARLRQMRSMGFEIERKYVKDGLHQYRLKE